MPEIAGTHRTQKSGLYLVVGLEGIAMITVTCKYCGKEFKAKRRSRKVCDDKECQRKANNERVKKSYKKHRNKRKEYYKKYYKKHQEELRFKQAQRNLRIQRLKKYWGNNITDIDIENYIDMNPTQTEIICEECDTKFFWNWKVMPKYRYNQMIMELSFKQNVTPWGSPVCPNCGLVGRSKYDGDVWEWHRRHQPRPATDEEILEIRKELKKVEHPPKIKSYAKYFEDGEHIDFVEEAEEVRAILLVVVKGKKKSEVEEMRKEGRLLTEEEKDECVRALLDSFKK